MIDKSNGNRTHERDRMRARRAAHPGEELARRRAEHALNPTKRQAYQRAYYAAHREEVLARTALYKATHLEERREQGRQYRKSRDRDAVRAKQRLWYKRTHKQRLDYQKAWRSLNIVKERKRSAASKRKHYAGNFTKLQARHRAWVKANPDKHAAAFNRRRTLKAGAAGSHTEKEWKQKTALYSNCCVYCGVSGRMTRDHDIPLSRGGSDYISNILPACKACNSRKKDRTAQEFIARLAA